MELRQQGHRKEQIRGHVEDHFCLDIRRLLKEKIIVKGETTTWVGVGDFFITIDADLERNHELSIQLSFLEKQQTLRCTYGTDKLKRTRLFFVDDKGGNVEKIYLLGDRFVSRTVGRLAFRKQSKTKIGPRTLRERVKRPLEIQLQSSLTEEKRIGLKKDLEGVTRSLDAIMLAKVGLCVEQRWRRREQRKRFRRRFRTAQLKMNRRVTTTPEQILLDYAELVEGLADVTPRLTSNPSFILAPPDPNHVSLNFENLPHIDTGMLARMGLIREGEISACQLGWPIKWLPQRRRRLYLIVDCRNSEKPYAAVISHTIKKARGHLFWLCEKPGRFGRVQYKFECPYSGRTSPILLYENGRFGPLLNFSHEETEDPVRRLIRLQIREGFGQHGDDCQPSAERLALLKKVVADAALLGQWRRDLVEMANELKFDDASLPQVTYPQILVRTD
jgi:hypothetical protein